MVDSNRLRWQCRRGMLELDYILEAFLDQAYLSLGPDDQQAFEQLLTTADPELHGWLLGGVAPPSAFREVVEIMRKIRAGNH